MSRSTTSPSFLDADERLRYLQTCRPDTDTATDELQHIRGNHIRWLYMQPLNDDVHCNQAMYAACVLTTVVALLRSKGDIIDDNDDGDCSPLLDDAVEWTAVRILLAPSGEQRLPLVMSVYDHMQLDAHRRRQLLERVVSGAAAAKLPPQSPASTLHKTHRLLDRIAALGTLPAMLAVIERIVRLNLLRNDDVAVDRLEILLEMMLTPPTDFARYQLSCLVYQRFVHWSAERAAVYAAFVRQLIRLLDRFDGSSVTDVELSHRGLFHRCLQYVDFYEMLVAKLTRYLLSIRSIVDADRPEDRPEMSEADVDFDTDVGDYPDDDAYRIRFADVRRIVCCMLHWRSPVRRKFATRLRQLPLASVVRRNVTHVLVYDCD